MKRLVSVKVLGRIGSAKEEHGKYLKRRIVYIDGQGFEWLEDPKHIAVLIQNRCMIGAKPRSMPGSNDTGRTDILGLWTSIRT